MGQRKPKIYSNLVEPQEFTVLPRSCLSTKRLVSITKEFLPILFKSTLVVQLLARISLPCWPKRAGNGLQARRSIRHCAVLSVWLAESIWANAELIPRPDLDILYQKKTIKQSSNITKTSRIPHFTNSKYQALTRTQISGLVSALGIRAQREAFPISRP